MGNTMSILVIGYDGYSDLWDDCIRLLKRFWSDCPFEIVFVNNVKDVHWENVTVLHAGENAEWSRKVQVGLKYINTKYICLFLEDFFVSDNIATSEVYDLMDIMSRNGIQYAKLVDMNNAKKDHNKGISENKKIHKVRFSDDYGISLQPSIWEKSFLLDKVGIENYNAWIFEFDRVSESDYRNKKYMDNAVFDTRNILKIKHGVLQGMFIPNTINYFKKIGIDLNVNRPIMKKSKYRKQRMISLMKGLLPLRMRRFVKKIMEKFGVKFVSTTRGNKNGK